MAAGRSPGLRGHGRCDASMSRMNRRRDELVQMIQALSAAEGTRQPSAQDWLAQMDRGAQDADAPEPQAMAAAPEDPTGAPETQPGD